MTRVARITLAIGLLAALGWVVLATLGRSVMPSYLAGWLFCLSLPLGALPVLMLLELLGVTGWPIIVPLRRFLLLQPVAMVFAVPVLLRADALYARPGLLRPGSADWLGPGFLAARMIAMLVIWTALAWFFVRPPQGRPIARPRRLLASFGLFVHLVIGSVAAVDWVMLLDPGLASSAFGLLGVILQVSIALCAATFVLALGGGTMPAETAPLLLAALGCWMFVHFIQFLIVWSADLPTEIVWYRHRIGGLGGAALWFGFTAAVVAIGLLLPHRLGRVPGIAAGVAAMLLLVHAVEMLWLITPGFRGRFILSLPDVAAMGGLGCLSAAFLLAGAGRIARHAGA